MGTNNYINSDKEKIIEYLKLDVVKDLFDSLDIGVHIVDSNGITVLYMKIAIEIMGIFKKRVELELMRILSRSYFFGIFLALHKYG